ncbi:MAG: hypothetical protein K9J25_09970 [Bacteroidales bacterium]|nr:hypothetical protein [Bacteroidales bacterium]
MKKVKILFAVFLLLLSCEMIHSQDTFFPACYKYYSNENYINRLFEEYYQDARSYVSDGHIDSIKQSSMEMKSLSLHDHPVSYGLLQTQDGIIHYFNKNNGEAIKEFLKALDLYSEGHYYNGINVLMNNIAIIFALVGDNLSAKSYIERAIELNRGRNLAFNTILSLNLAQMEITMGNYATALDNLKELLRNEETNYERVSPLAIIASIISANNKMGNKQEASEWINRGYLEMDESFYSNIDRLSFFTAVMEYHFINGDYENVISIAKRHSLDEQSNLPDQQDHMKYLCRAYAEQGDLTNAWKYENILQELHDNETMVNREEIIDLLIAEYEETRNIRTRENIENQIILNRNKQEASHRLMLLAFIALGIFIILFIILLRINKLRGEYKDELERKSEKSASINRELQKTNKELEKENKLLDTLTSVFAHDLINPFQAILGFSRLMVDDYESLYKNSMKEYSSMLVETSLQLNQLLTNLQNISRIQEGKQKLHPESLNIADYVNEVIKMYKPLAERKNINIVCNIDKAEKVPINHDVLNSVLSNIINNAIKFSENDSEIRIKTYREEGFIKLSVEDDGKGMDDATKEKILAGSLISSTPGTGSEKGSGLGLTICIELLEMNNGKLEINNKRTRGSTVIMKIPADNA